MIDSAKMIFNPPIILNKGAVEITEIQPETNYIELIVHVFASETIIPKKHVDGLIRNAIGYLENENFIETFGEEWKTGIAVIVHQKLI